MFKFWGILSTQLILILLRLETLINGEKLFIIVHKNCLALVTRYFLFDLTIYFANG